MIELLIMLMGVVAWFLAVAACVWALYTFREVRNEIRMIRRYLQAIHEQSERKHLK